jgi:nitroreductase
MISGLNVSPLSWELTKNKYSLTCKLINMYRKFLFLALIVLLSLSMAAQTAVNSTTDVLLSGYSAKAYTSDPVSDKDLEVILKCGIKSPSAKNLQLWKFTVVKDNALVNQVIKNFTPGNVIIIVSGKDTTGFNIDFDCGLATENIYVAAQGLGLGSHIYTGPIKDVNSRKEAFAIPAGYRAVSIVRIGTIDKGVDAVSAASARKSFEDVVNYK